jgi:DNA-binding CsgD family transcriptional regulator
MLERVTSLTEKDVRAIVRLLGKVVTSPRNFNQQRRMIMNGLSRLICADAWLWCMANYKPDDPLTHSGILHGGFDDTRFARFLEAINHPALESVSRRSAIELQNRGRQITRTLAQLEDPGVRLMDSEAGPFWKRAGIGTLMLSLRPMETGGITGIGMYRNLGRPDFQEKDAAIAHILLTEIPWLYYEKFEDLEEVSRLYPRHRTVLNLLCEGWDRNKIASHLGRSIHTINGYVKEIFKHFGVNSQSELIARFTKGDGGDK